jgi:hypothetical protein
MQVYTDRLVTDEGQVLAMSGDVVADVEISGNQTATRGRNLAAKAVGTAVLGPIGLFGIGNATTKVTDTREVFLTVQGPDWQVSRRYGPDTAIFARAFAQAVNLTARIITPDAPPPTQRDQPVREDPLERIEKLGKLRDSGLLTDAEFEEQKKKLLAAL